MPKTEEGRALRRDVDALPFWCHSIDLGLGVVTPGVKTPAFHARELASLQLPDLRGKSACVCLKGRRCNRFHRYHRCATHMVKRKA